MHILINKTLTILVNSVIIQTLSEIKLLKIQIYFLKNINFIDLVQIKSITIIPYYTN